MTTITKEQLIEDLKASTQNASGMFEISEDTICALMSMLASPPAPVSVPDESAIFEAAIDICRKSDAIDEHAWNHGVLAVMSAFRTCRAAMLQGAESRPELTVWYGSMQETNGKTNWTAMLHRKGQHPWDGITIECSEYPDRVRYEADRMRHLIGELSDDPDILAYDADAHSGYVKPSNSPVIPDGWVACSEQMPEDEQEVIVQNKMGYRYVSYFDEHSGLFFDMRGGNQMNCIEHIFVTHWMPLPAAPQQEVKK